MIAEIELVVPQIAELCRRHRVRKLDVFGSAASGESFDPSQSDVDFFVEFEEGVDLGPWLSEYFRFKEALEELCGHPIDLVLASAPRNPYFVREMNRTRQRIYAPLSG
jgi:predicted nucleotidyltransferase